MGTLAANPDFKPDAFIADKSNGRCDVEGCSYTFKAAQEVNIDIHKWQISICNFQAERHLKHLHGRTSRQANCPAGYQCNFILADGSTCNQHFVTKHEKESHKRKEKHIKPKPAVEDGGTRKKPAKKKRAKK